MDFKGTKICIVSRCAQTLYVFRRKIIGAFKDANADVVTIGVGGDGYESKVIETGALFESVNISFRGINPLSDLRTIWLLYRALRKHQPDGVQLYTIKPVIYGAIAAKLAGVPAVTAMVTGLGHVFTSSRPMLRRLSMAMYRFSLHYVHIVYFQNRTDRDLFVDAKLVVAAKTRLINGSGVDVEEFKPRASSVPVGNGLHFLMIGRLIREKGVVEFLDAAAMVRKRFPETRFSLVGEVDQRNPSAMTRVEVEQAAEVSGVGLLGYLADVRDAIASADVIVLPSYREGTPKSLLEAAAMGKAMIASNVPGCTEVVIHQKTGLLFPARNAVALAETMEYCLNNREQLKDFGTNARELAIQRFDVKSVNQQLVSDMFILISQNA